MKQNYTDSTIRVIKLKPDKNIISKIVDKNKLVLQNAPEF